MKDYLRAHPALSLCGLCCALCPIHQMQNGCPGCGGGRGTSPAPSSGAVWNMAARSSAPSAPNSPAKDWPKLCSTIPFFPTATCLPICSECARAALRTCWRSFPRGRAFCCGCCKTAMTGGRRRCSALQQTCCRWMCSNLPSSRSASRLSRKPTLKKAALSRSALQAVASGCGISLKPHKKKP